jgi:hypothetical protein
MAVTKAVAALEGELGRNVRPFTMTLTVLPVVESAVRKVADGHFLIPERVYLGPELHDVVKELVLPLA